MTEHNMLESMPTVFCNPAATGPTRAAPASASNAQNGQLHVTKYCMAYTLPTGGFCTIKVLESRGDPGRLDSLL